MGMCVVLSIAWHHVLHSACISRDMSNVSYALFDVDIVDPFSRRFFSIPHQMSLAVKISIPSADAQPERRRVAAVFSPPELFVDVLDARLSFFGNSLRTLMGRPMSHDTFWGGQAVFWYFC